MATLSRVGHTRFESSTVTCSDVGSHHRLVPVKPEVTEGRGACDRARSGERAGLAVETRAEAAAGTFGDERGDFLRREERFEATRQRIEHRRAEARNGFGGSEESRVTRDPVARPGPRVFVVGDAANLTASKSDRFGRQDALGEIARCFSQIRAERASRPSGAETSRSTSVSRGASVARSSAAPTSR